MAILVRLDEFFVGVCEIFQRETVSFLIFGYFHSDITLTLGRIFECSEKLLRLLIGIPYTLYFLTIFLDNIHMHKAVRRLRETSTSALTSIEF